MTEHELAYQREYRARHRERDREANNARKRTFYAKRRADGICYRCKLPSGTESHYCEYHRQKANDEERRYRAARPEKYRAATSRWRAKNADKARDQQFRRLYGLGSAEVDAMLAAQGGRCAICRTDNPDTRMRWHVDHCHTTALVRGILCHKCNMGIGALKDDPARLRAAADYLERHKS